MFEIGSWVLVSPRLYNCCLISTKSYQPTDVQLLHTVIVDLFDFEDRVDKPRVRGLADALQRADHVNVRDVVANGVGEEISQRLEVVDVAAHENHVLELIPGNPEHVIGQNDVELLLVKPHHRVYNLDANSRAKVFLVVEVHVLVVGLVDETDDDLGHLADGLLDVIDRVNKNAKVQQEAPVELFVFPENGLFLRNLRPEHFDVPVDRLLDGSVDVDHRLAPRNLRRAG